LRTYLIEEAYEVLDAMNSGDDAKFANEMGDLLLQVVFHSQIATEEGRFTVADVIREVHEKMVRRHPHVFGEKRAKDAAEVLRNWEQIKAEERQGAEERQSERKSSGAVKKEDERKSLLDGVPRGLPSTMEGLQLTRKASRAGFDWQSAEGVFEKLREETGELRDASVASDAQKTEEEMGDLLFAAVNLARFLQVDPEIALKNANGKFARRFREMERLAAEKGQAFAEVARADKEQLWEMAKRSEDRLTKSEAAGKR
jgi:MazG family protein